MQKLATVFYVRSQGEGWVLDAGQWRSSVTHLKIEFIFSAGFSAMKCNTLLSKERMATDVGCWLYRFMLEM